MTRINLSLKFEKIHMYRNRSHINNIEISHRDKFHMNTNLKKTKTKKRKAPLPLFLIWRGHRTPSFRTYSPLLEIPICLSSHFLYNYSIYKWALEILVIIFSTTTIFIFLADKTTRRYVDPTSINKLDWISTVLKFNFFFFFFFEFKDYEIINLNFIANYFNEF